MNNTISTWLSKKCFRRLFPAAGLLLCLLLCLAVATGCGRETESGGQVQNEKAEELRQKLAPLEDEQKILRQEISRRKREEGLTTRKTGVGELIVLGADPRILSEIVPLIREHSTAPASFAFSETDFPGLPGKMEVQDYRSLKKEGWTACLYWGGDEAPDRAGDAGAGREGDVKLDRAGNVDSDWDESGNLDRWLGTMEARFREIGEPLPEAILFAEGSYDPALDPVLAEHGITIAVHHGENELPLMCGADMESEIWHPGACGYYDMVARQKQDYLEQAEDLYKNIVYTVCVPAEEATAADAEAAPGNAKTGGPGNGVAATAPGNAKTGDPGNGGAEPPGGTASSAIFEAGSRYEEHPFAQFMGYWDKDTRELYLTPKGLYEARDYLYRCSIPASEAELLDDEIRAKRERIVEIDAEIRALYEEYYRETGKK